MRRLLSRALTACAALSLLLLIGVLVLWVRSYWTFDLRGREGATSLAGRRAGGNVTSGGGVVTAEYWVRDTPGAKPEPGTGWDGFSQPLRPEQPGARDQYLASIGATRFLGVAWASYWMDPSPGGRNGGGRFALTQSATYLQMPYPYPAAALAALPAWWLWRRWRRHRGRRRPGHCPACGYNLTGNVSGKCPECGEAVGQEAPGK